MDRRRDQSPAERSKAFKVSPVHKDVEVTYIMCSSMLPRCKAAVVYSHQLVPGISYRDERISCEITNEPTAPLHTHAHADIFVGASQPANADATTWSKNAPMVINKQHFGWGGTDGGLDREREGRRECGSAGQIRLRGFFFFFFKHEIVSVLLKCMFEVGVQLNTSCLKKTDARVAQEMRERPQRGRGEGVEGREKRIHEKITHKLRERNVWNEHEVIRHDKELDRERKTERRPPVVQTSCCSI